MVRLSCLFRFILNENSKKDFVESYIFPYKTTKNYPKKRRTCRSNFYKFKNTMTEAGEFWNVDSSHIVTNGVFDTFLSYTTIMLNITTIHALRKTSSLPKPLKTLFCV